MMNELIDKNLGYTVSTKINSSPADAFMAIATGLSNWWGDMDNPIQNVGDVFTVSWGEPWYQFKVIGYEPNEKLVWECIDANQIIGDLKGVQKEWVGTKVYWTITPLAQNEIEIKLTHQGLIPAFICYEVCSTTWERFITQRLKQYLEALD